MRPQSIAGYGSTCLSSQAIREAKIRRIVVPGQPRQKSVRDSISREKKLDVVAYTCLPTAGSIK
jgi:hypothetical protein